MPAAKYKLPVGNLIRRPLKKPECKTPIDLPMMRMLDEIWSLLPVQQ